MMWFFIDSAIIPLSWALTMSKPSGKLVSKRPTAKLVGILFLIERFADNFIGHWSNYHQLFFYAECYFAFI